MMTITQGVTIAAALLTGGLGLATARAFPDETAGFVGGTFFGLAGGGALAASRMNLHPAITASLAFVGLTALGTAGGLMLGGLMEAAEGSKATLDMGKVGRKGGRVA